MDLHDLNEFDGKSHPPLKEDPGEFKASEDAGPRRQRRSERGILVTLRRWLRRPWLVMLGVALVVVAGVGIWAMAWRSAGESAEAVAIGEEPVLSPEEVAAAMLPEQVAEAFLAAESLEERLKWTRDGEAVRGLMEGEGVAEAVAVYPLTWTELKFMGVARTKTQAFDMFQAVLEDGSSRLVAVVDLDEGPRVDWAAFARYQPESWESIMGNGAREEPVSVRAFVELSDYYNYEYADEEEWTCYKITSPDLEGRLFGYGRRGEKWDDDLRAFLKMMTPAGGRPRLQRVVMELEVGEDLAERGQVRIKEVGQFGWVEERAAREF
ncbi:MAG: hypothetical protein AAF591_06360 [Verrucomicrobiota bacterium]